MKSFNCVIVECDTDYLNEKELEGGISLVVNTTIESVEHINRVAKVLAAPKQTILKEGDEVIIHHNILRRRRDMKGVEVESDFLLEDGMYYVPVDMIFAYRRGDMEWEALAPYFFVKPIEKEVEKTTSGIFLESGTQKYVNREAEVRYLNKVLREEWGLEQGDVVGYDKNQEYKFEIDGELLYRVRMPKLLYKKCRD